MTIVVTPVDPDDLRGGINLTVTLNGVVTWDSQANQTGQGQFPDLATPYVYLQSHWGSGVKFTSATIASP